MIHKIIANSVINELFFNMFEKQVLKIQIRFLPLGLHVHPVESQS